MFALAVVAMMGVIVQLSQANTDVRLPPKIIKGPILDKTFRPDAEVQLECKAVGIPEPRYTWIKDGRHLEPKANVIFTIDGILITQLSRLDEGNYQCRAENQYGTSLSDTTVLRYAFVGTYISTVPNDYYLTEGQPYVLKNVPLNSFPTATYSWHIGESVSDNSPRGIIQSKRLQIDEEGNLHFSYLIASDAQDGRVYKCNVFNPIVDYTVGGSYSRLHITPRGVNEFAPVLAFASKNPVVAVLGRSVTLRCFFSGYPEPSLTWSKLNGSMPIGRYELLNYNSKFLIHNVRQSDEGDYKCRGANSANKGSFTDEIIQIDVQSAPSFTRPEDRPIDTNVTEGETAIFKCNAIAEPVATIVWMRNGDVLSPTKMPPRMRITNNGRELAIDKVCKNCLDGSRDSDLMVIQCTAANVHGNLLSDAYLNILEKTKITVAPQDVHLEFDKLSTSFLCVATSDDSTPYSVSWFRVIEDGNTDVPVSNSMQVTVSEDGTKLSFSLSEDQLDQWPQHRGKYRCHASNGYSEDNAEVTLTVDDPPPTLPPTTEPTEPTTIMESTPITAAALAAASLANFWWILVIAAAVLLIVIIFIICWLCCRRCKGDTYFVDKKERQDHKDPEKELHDTAMQPYHRRDNMDGLKDSRASLGDSMKDSDEDDDLDEYGDMDAGKFTEDGSFIGDYATEQRKRGRHGDSVA